MRRFILWLPAFVLLGGVVYGTLFFHQPLKRLFISGDKEGQILEQEGKWQEALGVYEDPLRIGNLYYKNGEFKKALEFYERASTKEALYNRANAQMMLGKYNDAIENYSLALKADAAFQQARENRAIAIARQAQLDAYKNQGQKGSKLGADKVVYGGKNFNQEQSEEMVVQEGFDGTVNTWLDRLETSPQGFLASKFRYQYEAQKRGR